MGGGGFFYFVSVFETRVSLCILGWPRSHCVVQAVLTLIDLSVFASQVLKVKMCTTMPYLKGYSLMCQASRAVSYMGNGTLRTCYYKNIPLEHIDWFELEVL